MAGDIAETIANAAVKDVAYVVVTDVHSTPNRVDLQYEEAAPLLNQGLTRVLSGLLRATAPLPRQCRSAEERACLLPDRFPGQGRLDEMPAFPDPAAPGRKRPRTEFTPARTASSDAGSTARCGDDVRRPRTWSLTT